jgi:hypothetical protein
MKIGIQSKKRMSSSEITKRRPRSIFKTAAAAILLIEVNAVKWAITTATLMKFGTQTKKSMLSFKITIPEAYGKKNSKN